jgi:hypothetical protein
MNSLAPIAKRNLMAIIWTTGVYLRVPFKSTLALFHDLVNIDFIDDDIGCASRIVSGLRKCYASNALVVGPLVRYY